MTQLSAVADPSPPKTLHESIKEAFAAGHKQTEIARAIGYSTGALSGWFKGSYNADARKLEASLVAWLRRNGYAVDETPGEVYVETRASQTAVRACTVAHEEGALAAIVGPPGTGKTMGLRAFERHARAEGIRYVLVTATTVSRSAVAIVRKISKALGVSCDSSAALLVDAIIEKLARDTAVVIVDEAQHLEVKALEVLRSIHDETRTGLVLCGSEELEDTLQVRGDGRRLAQLRDRIAQFERTRAMQPIEVAKFVERIVGAEVDDDALAEIHKISRKVPRRLARLLAHCRRLSAESGKLITVALVREAARKLADALEEVQS